MAKFEYFYRGEDKFCVYLNTFPFPKFIQQRSCHFRKLRRENKIKVLNQIALNHSFNHLDIKNIIHNLLQFCEPEIQLMYL